jgi:hypothetical protein
MLVAGWKPGNPANVFSATRKKIACALAVLVLFAVLMVRHFSGGSDAARAELLRFVPSSATSVVFVDLDQLRSSPFLAALYSWLPAPAEDSEYTQFVEETGFNYERDLSELFVAVSHRGASSSTLVVADGKFDRRRIEAFLAHHGSATEEGGRKLFMLHATRNGQPLSVAFLSDRRMAVADSEPVTTALQLVADQAARTEWQVRFDRLAGTPAFSVFRQDPAIAVALGGATPGGFRSPQLAALLEQLRWISIAAKPDGQLLRLVADGECPSNKVASELSDFLQGIQVLAQNGLNDPQLRRQMNADQRQAYLELLKSADIEKIDRGESKSVRLVLSVTPQFLAVANLSGLIARPGPGDPPAHGEPGPATRKSPAAKKR